MNKKACIIKYELLLEFMQKAAGYALSPLIR